MLHSKKEGIDVIHPNMVGEVLVSYQNDKITLKDDVKFVIIEFGKKLDRYSSTFFCCNLSPASIGPKIQKDGVVLTGACAVRTENGEFPAGAYLGQTLTGEPVQFEGEMHRLYKKLEEAQSGQPWTTESWSSRPGTISGSLPGSVQGSVPVVVTTVPISTMPVSTIQTIPIQTIQSVPIQTQTSQWASVPQIISQAGGHHNPEEAKKWKERKGHLVSRGHRFPEFCKDIKPGPPEEPIQYLSGITLYHDGKSCLRLEEMKRTSAFVNGKDVSLNFVTLEACYKDPSGKEVKVPLSEAKQWFKPCYFEIYSVTLFFTSNDGCAHFLYHPEISLFELMILLDKRDLNVKDALLINVKPANIFWKVGPVQNGIGNADAVDNNLIAICVK